MFRQDSAIFREQLGSFWLTSTSVGGREVMEQMVEPMYRRVMQRTVMEHYQVHTTSWVPEVVV
jgi:hypothetical protein